MQLEPDEADEFFRLHRIFMAYVNRELSVFPVVADADDFRILSPEERLAVRKAFLERLDLIDSFVEENPNDLTEDELEIVRSWRHLVAGKLFFFRQLKKYMVVLTTDDEGKKPIAYGVLSITEPFEDLIGKDLPQMVETVLLPYRGRITYDGLLGAFKVYLGPGIRSSLEDSYREAKAGQGMITSLPPVKQPQTTKSRTKKATKSKKGSSKNPIQGRWRITWMEAWDQSFVDEEVEGFFEFGKKGLGDFQFGYVSGGIDYDLCEREGRPAVEFSWEGQDEMEPASGRGWAVLDGDEIEGKIYFHQGDQSAFRAIKSKPQRRSN